MFDLSDLYNLRYVNGLFSLWVTFYDCYWCWRTLKCWRKLWEDIYDFYKFFKDFMFRDCDVTIIRWHKKNSFIIVIRKND